MQKSACEKFKSRGTIDVVLSLGLLGRACSRRLLARNVRSQYLPIPDSVIGKSVLRRSDIATRHVRGKVKGTRLLANLTPA